MFFFDTFEFLDILMSEETFARENQSMEPVFPLVTEYNQSYRLTNLIWTGAFKSYCDFLSRFIVCGKLCNTCKTLHV